METAIQAFEVTGVLDENKRLLIDTPLPIGLPVRVRAIILIDVGSNIMTIPAPDNIEQSVGDPFLAGFFDGPATLAENTKKIISENGSAGWTWKSQ